MKPSVAFVCLLACCTSVVRGAIITQWSFESSTPNSAGPIAAENGGGVAKAVGLGGHGSPLGNGSSRSFSANAWAVGDYWQFAFASTGFGDLSFTFDQTSSGTGPRDFEFSYSLDGVGFIVVGGYSVSPITWSSSTVSAASSRSFDLSSISALEHAANVTFRLTNSSTTSASGGTIGATGTNRIDNVTVRGTALPPPVPVSVPDTFPGWILPFTLAALGWTLNRRSGTAVQRPELRRRGI